MRNRRFICAILCTSVLISLSIAQVSAQEEQSEQSEKENKTEKSEESKKKDSYEKFTSEDAVRKKGLIDIIIIEKDYYFEIGDHLLGKDMLLGERVSELSNSGKVAAGEMRKDPILIRFSRDDEKVYLHKVVSGYEATESDPVSIAVKRTSIDPILQIFDIEALNEDSTAAVIDITSFYSEEIKDISPFNSKYKAGSLQKDATQITKVQAFPKNVEVRTYMSYSNTTTDPFSIVVHRSLLLLPEVPVRPRYEDPRIGYFAGSKTGFSTDTIGVESIKFIHRFDIRPKKEDMDRYLAGELVEPEKQIVFYIDDAFPKAWRKYIQAGVEDWQKPFEAIGFKNAIIAKDYPKDDPDFHPEDIRYSCVRYISLPKANSMGPRWVDPRSGEIIGGDMLWWHNVVELLRDWRFVQTGAADPAARKRNPDIDVLGPMIRYVAAHELGHVFGLKHNMRASYAYPVDSLRSPEFTTKHGTTASIMDYARFNYIAQPGDGVTYFLPPVMGPYDYYAIKWGYKPIPEAETAKDEYSVLNEWILEKAGDPVYQYGDQQMGAPCMDPAAQNEALGDNAILASTLGVKNLKFIMDHLVDWTEFENENFDYMDHMYEQVMKQYERYIGHVASYIGGVYIYQLVGGEDKRYITPVEEDKQIEAIGWLFNELGIMPEWIINKGVEDKMSTKKMDLMKLQADVMDKMMSGAVLQRIFMYHDDFSCQDYLDQLHQHVWRKTLRNEPLDEYERNLQATYIRNLIAMQDGKDSPSLPGDESLDGLSSPNGSKVPSSKNIVDPLIYQKILDTKKMLKKKLKQKDPVMKAHYKYLFELI